MAMIGMLVLGLLIGIGLAWHLDERRHAADMAAREARHAARLRGATSTDQVLAILAPAPDGVSGEHHDQEAAT